MQKREVNMIKSRHIIREVEEGSIAWELELEPGDELYLYTDGVTEATNSSQELFGEERLQAALNEEPDLPVHKLLPKIKGCIDAFVGEAEQFDDITMLGLHYMERGEKTDG